MAIICLNMSMCLYSERKADMSKWELFVELANPDPTTGVSRWVTDPDEYTGKYSCLVHANGWDWGRRDGPLCQRYQVEVDRSVTPGNSIDRIRLAGYRQDKSFQKNIRSDIRDALKDRNCVMLGVNGTTANTQIEIDHKDGRKDDMRVSDMATQRIEDFQPLCKAANDIKRQICKRCRETDRRWCARNIPGNPYDFYEGGEEYTAEMGCRGCYQYDPVEYRIQSALRLSNETAEFIMRKFYPDYCPPKKG